MKFIAALLSTVVLTAGAAGAAEINAQDESGAPITVNTDSLKGCAMIFDQAGNPFQICKMERVEFRPVNSTRARPGQVGKKVEREVIYRRAGS